MGDVDWVVLTVDTNIYIPKVIDIINVRTTSKIDMDTDLNSGKQITRILSGPGLGCGLQKGQVLPAF